MIRVDHDLYLFPIIPFAQFRNLSLYTCTEIWKVYEPYCDLKRILNLNYNVVSYNPADRMFFDNLHLKMHEPAVPNFLTFKRFDFNRENAV